MKDIVSIFLHFSVLVHCPFNCQLDFAFMLTFFSSDEWGSDDAEMTQKLLEVV